STLAIWGVHITWGSSLKGGRCCDSSSRATTTTDACCGSTVSGRKVWGSQNSRSIEVPAIRGAKIIWVSPATSTATPTATARSRRRIVDRPSDLELQQACHRRRLAGLGGLRKLEDHARVAERRPVEPTAGKRPAVFGEVVETAVDKI